MRGFLVIDKPVGVTSHDVVAIVRAVTGLKKVGHTGTLDPFATGVLALALGGATRTIQYLDESLKVYDATVKFGVAMDTGDPTGEVLREAPVPQLTEAAVDAVLQGMVGQQQQVPPPYSAVKVRGKPLYWYARRGEVVEVPAREITIYGMERLALTEDTLRVRIRCSRGTYARVLAEDIAKALGTEGHLVALAREQSGPFLLDHALDKQGLADIVSGEPGRTADDVLFYKGPREDRVAWAPRAAVRQALGARLVSLEQALSHLPLLTATPEMWKAVRDGRAPAVVPEGVSVGTLYRIVGPAREGHPAPLALGKVTPAGPAIERLIG